MSPIGKIRISVFLLGILICLFVASANGQQAGESSDEDDGSNSEEGENSSVEEQQQGRRGRGGRGPGGPGYRKNRKFKKSGKFSDLFEESTDGPSFCQQKACPKFTVESQTEDYELRNYAETNWLTVNTPGRFLQSFRILLNYLKGGNAENRKIKIGVPVLKEYVGDNAQLKRMLFYTSETNLPTPTDDAVKIVRFPSGRRYVKVFDGFATPKVTADKKTQLISKISGGYDTGSYYGAIFNPPFQKKDRHNEIWVFAKEVAV